MTELLLPKTMSQTAATFTEATVPITDHLVPDEKAWKLVEMNRIDTTSRHVRRWEFIYVVRDDAVAVHIRDMGPPTGEQEVTVWGLWEETWEKLREDANQMRLENSLGRFFTDRKGEMEKMVDVWMKWRMELWEQSQNRSHFGPKYTRQRNAFVRSK